MDVPITWVKAKARTVATYVRDAGLAVAEHQGWNGFSK